MSRFHRNSLSIPLFAFLSAALLASLMTTSCTSIKQRAAERDAAIQLKAKPKTEETVEKPKIEKTAEKKVTEPDPISADVTEIRAPIPETDPEKAYLCEFQALITKFEAYGSSLPNAQAKVKALCIQRFGIDHCVDAEDLHCRKTFY